VSLTHYGTLGVERAATDQEIRAAYRALAGQHHPDRGGDHDAMARITVAYDWLRDRREAYEDFLIMCATDCGACNGEGRTYKQKGFTARVAVRCKACNGEGVTHVNGAINVMRMGNDAPARRKKR